MNRRLKLTQPVLATLIAFVLVLAFVVMSMPALVTALFIGTGGDTDPEAKLSRLVALHNDAEQQYIDRFNGRSMFFKPKIPPKPVERPVIVKNTEPQDNTPPPPPPPPPPTPAAPAEYGGREPVGVVGNFVWFASNGEEEIRIPVGGEVDADTQIIDIVSANLVRMKWTKRGHESGEYDVAIFKSTVFDAPGEARTSHDFSMKGEPARGGAVLSSGRETPSATDKSLASRRAAARAARNRARSSDGNDDRNPPD